MELFLEKSVSATNRVAILQGFLPDNPPNKQDLVSDAFRVTQELLMDLSQTGHGDEVARYLKKDQPFVGPDHWETFVADQVSSLQQLSLLQKQIELLGDDLSNWRPQKISPDLFVAAIRGLEYLVMFDPENQIGAWCTSTVDELCQRLEALSQVLTGITLIGINDKKPNESQAFTAITFAAARLTYGGRAIMV